MGEESEIQVASITVRIFKDDICVDLKVFGVAGVAKNGYRLGDVADFQHKCSIELLLLNLAQIFHRGTSVAILPNRCYA